MLFCLKVGLVCVIILLSSYLCTSVYVHSFDTVRNDFWIQDPTSILTSSQKHTLNVLIDRNSALKRNVYPCGNINMPYQIGVAIVDKMKLSSNISNTSINIMDYATDVFNNVQLGYAECNNGVLLFVSFDDREIGIITGSGINPKVLSHDDIDSIIYHIGSFFKKQDKFTGLREGIIKLSNHLIYKSDTVYKSNSSNMVDIIILGGFTFTILYIIGSHCSNNYYCSHCQQYGYYYVCQKCRCCCSYYGSRSYNRYNSRTGYRRCSTTSYRSSFSGGGRAGGGRSGRF